MNDRKEPCLQQEGVPLESSEDSAASDEGQIGCERDQPRRPESGSKEAGDRRERAGCTYEGDDDIAGGEPEKGRELPEAGRTEVPGGLIERRGDGQDAVPNPGRLS